MRILIVTQAVDRDDPVLGFFHRWIAEFAAHAEHVHVICLKEGRHNLPVNVHVHSLGKESGRSRIKYVARFFRYVWALRREYDAVFVHMNPEYVVLGGVFWKLMRKPVALWFVHRVRNWWIIVASRIVRVVITSAPKSIGIRSNKVIVIGHGIDLAAFAGLAPRTFDASDIRLVTIGRITPIKRLEVIVQAVALLRNDRLNVSLDIVGSAAVPADDAYVEVVRAEIGRLCVTECVFFRGAVTYDRIPVTLNKYDISVNACPTGGIDKTVLESALAGPLVLASNLAFESYFGEDAGRVIFDYGDAADLARAIRALVESSDREALRERLRTKVAANSDVTVLVPRILSTLYGSSTEG